MKFGLVLCMFKIICARVHSLKTKPKKLQLWLTPAQYRLHTFKRLAG